MTCIEVYLIHTIQTAGCCTTEYLNDSPIRTDFSPIFLLRNSAFLFPFFSWGSCCDVTSSSLRKCRWTSSKNYFLFLSYFPFSLFVSLFFPSLLQWIMSSLKEERVINTLRLSLVCVKSEKKKKIRFLPTKTIQTFFYAGPTNLHGNM